MKLASLSTAKKIDQTDIRICCTCGQNRATWLCTDPADHMQWWECTSCKDKLGSHIEVVPLQEWLDEVHYMPEDEMAKLLEEEQARIREQFGL